MKAIHNCSNFDKSITALGIIRNNTILKAIHNIDSEVALIEKVGNYKQ